MKSFHAYLLEKNMDLATAMSIFGIKNIPTPEDLKTMFRRKALEVHPDKGGSVQDMQQLNLAYEYLKDAKPGDVGFSRQTPEDREREKEEHIARSKVKLKELLDKFKPEIFTKYFHEISGKNFNAKITPIPKDQTGKYVNWSSIGIDAVFTSDDGESYFDLSIRMDVSKYNMRKYSGSLGGGDVGIDMYIEAYGYHNNRKQKMAKRDWNFTNSHALFSDPAAVYPKAKVQKIFVDDQKKKAFTKKDAVLFIEKKLDGTVHNQSNGMWAYIPLFDGYEIAIYRSVMRLGAWNIWDITGPKPKRERIKLDYATIFEDEMALEQLREFVLKARKVKTRDHEEMSQQIRSIMKPYIQRGFYGSHYKG